MIVESTHTGNQQTIQLIKRNLDSFYALVKHEISDEASKYSEQLGDSFYSFELIARKEESITGGSSNDYKLPSQFFDVFLSNTFTSSNPQALRHPDGGLIENFGWVLGADGSLVNHYTSSAPDSEPFDRLGTWSQVHPGSRFLLTYCHPESCQFYNFIRSFEIFSTSDTNSDGRADRVNVREETVLQEDFDQDGQFKLYAGYSFGRFNQYDITEYYDYEDSDRDGIPNASDEFPADPSMPANIDGDNLPDAIDNDRDGDGIENSVDAFPDDPSEFLDSDGDGIGDNSDPDIDGDGISNAKDQCFNDPAAFAGEDQDGDGLCDESDLDDDNDGYPDADEKAQGTDALDATEYPSSGGYITTGSSLVLGVSEGGVDAPDFDASKKTARVLVHRMLSSSGRVSVKYRTRDGATSREGRDYESIEGELVWEDGDASSKEIVVNLTPQGDFDSQVMLVHLDLLELIQ